MKRLLFAASLAALTLLGCDDEPYIKAERERIKTSTLIDHPQPGVTCFYYRQGISCVREPESKHETPAKKGGE